MNALTLAVLALVTFSLGAVVGETYAPISGVTTQALNRRCAEVEARLAELEARLARLEAATRFWPAAWLAPELPPAPDGGVMFLRVK